MGASHTKVGVKGKSEGGALSQLVLRPLTYHTIHTIFLTFNGSKESRPKGGSKECLAQINKKRKKIKIDFHRTKRKIQDKL